MSHPPVGTRTRLFLFHIGMLQFRSYMKSILRIPLNATPEQQARLLALQETFAQACNALAPIVQKTRIWNRVALHHLAYRDLRAKFPAMGSQMACNVIYSVSRTCRIVFQHPASPLHLTRLGGHGLPLLHFETNSPVYFDRHTLSLKNGQLSLFTLDGRMHFQLTLRPSDQLRFQTQRLREIVLARRKDDVFVLEFCFAEDDEQPDTPDLSQIAAKRDNLPAYIKIEESA